MYNEFDVCKHKILSINWADKNVETSWFQWKRVRRDEEIKKHGKTEIKKVSITTKNDTKFYQ